MDIDIRIQGVALLKVLIGLVQGLCLTGILWGL